MGCGQSSKQPAKHRVSFEAARRVFDDAFAFDRLDTGGDGTEVRYIITGMVNGVLLTIVYTGRGERIRIISARKATRHEQKTTIITKRQSDGAFVQVMPDGTTRPLEDKTDWNRLREMTDEEVHVTALADPDAQPTTEADWNAARRVPRAKHFVARWE